MRRQEICAERASRYDRLPVGLGLTLVPLFGKQLVQAAVGKATRGELAQHVFQVRPWVDAYKFAAQDDTKGGCDGA